MILARGACAIFHESNSSISHACFEWDNFNSLSFDYRVEIWCLYTANGYRKSIFFCIDSIKDSFINSYYL